MIRYFIIILLITCNQVKVSSSDIEKFLFYSLSRGKATNLGNISGSGESFVKVKAEEIKCIEGQDLNLVIEKQNLLNEKKVSLYLSNSTRVNSSDQLIQTIVLKPSSNQEKISIKIPFLITDDTPKSRYLGVTSNEVKIISPTDDENKIVIFPRDSLIIPYNFNTGVFLNQTLSLNNSSKYFEFTPPINTDIIISAFNLTPLSSEDISLSYHFFGYNSSIVDLAGSSLVERIKFISPSKSFTMWSKVTLKSANSLTFSFIGSSTNINQLHYSASCTGGGATSMPTKTFAGICADFESNYHNTSRPIDNSTCSSDGQGAGSVYSLSSCPTVSRVAHCICLPVKNEGIKRYNFYSPNFTDSSSVSVISTSVCNSQNCFLYNN